MEDSNAFTAQDRDLIHARPDESNVFLAMNGDILGIGAGPDENGVTLLRGIHRLLNRVVLPRTIQSDHQRLPFGRNRSLRLSDGEAQDSDRGR